MRACVRACVCVCVFVCVYSMCILCALCVSCRWWHGQKCQSSTDGQTQSANGKDDRPKGTSTNGYVPQLVEFFDCLFTIFGTFYAGGMGALQNLMWQVQSGTQGMPLEWEAGENDINTKRYLFFENDWIFIASVHDNIFKLILVLKLMTCCVNYYMNIKHRHHSSISHHIHIIIHYYYCEWVICTLVQYTGRQSQNIEVFHHIHTTYCTCNDGYDGSVEKKNKKRVTHSGSNHGWLYRDFPQILCTWSFRGCRRHYSSWEVSRESQSSPLRFFVESIATDHQEARFFFSWKKSVLWRIRTRDLEPRVVSPDQPVTQPATVTYLFYY